LTIAAHLAGFALITAYVSAQQSDPCTGCAVGVILDCRTGYPLQGATVRIGNESATTNADGLYVVKIPGAAPRRVFNVDAALPGYKPCTTDDFTCDGDAAFRVPTLRLRPVGCIGMLAPDGTDLVQSPASQARRIGSRGFNQNGSAALSASLAVPRGSSRTIPPGDRLFRTRCPLNTVSQPEIPPAPLLTRTDPAGPRLIERWSLPQCPPPPARIRTPFADDVPARPFSVVRHDRSEPSP
jgi:hypothetical protein